MMFIIEIHVDPYDNNNSSTQATNQVDVPIKPDEKNGSNLICRIRNLLSAWLITVQENNRQNNGL